MRSIGPNPGQPLAGNLPVAGRTAAAARRTTVEVARARCRSAAQHGDWLAAEAAGRAHGAAVIRALLARFAHAFLILLRLTSRRLHWRRASSASVTDLNP